MAIWQYTFLIVSKQDLNNIGCDTSITKDIYQSYDFWQDESNVNEYELQLDEILPRGKSWSTNIVLFGKEESSNVEIFNNEGIINEINFRFDFRDKNGNILNKIIEFCIYNGLSLIAENFSIVSLNFETIMFLVENSSQYKKFEEFSRRDSVSD